MASTSFSDLNLKCCDNSDASVTMPMVNSFENFLFFLLILLGLFGYLFYLCYYFVFFLPLYIPPLSESIGSIIFRARGWLICKMLVRFL